MGLWGNTLEIESRQEIVEIKESSITKALNEWIKKRDYLVGITKETMQRRDSGAD